MVDEKKIKSAYQIEKEATELAIHKEYERLMAIPGAMAGAVADGLMRKYKIHSRVTIWAINKRVKSRLEKMNES